MYYNELAHTIIKTQIARNDQPSKRIETQEFSTEPKAQESTVEVQVQRTEGTDGWKFQSEAEDQCISISPVHRANSLSLSTFSVQIGQRTVPTQTGQGNLPYSVHQLKC